MKNGFHKIKTIIQNPFSWILVYVFLRLLLLNFAVALSGDDGDRYLREAINIVKHGVFSHQISDNPYPTAHDMPLFPYWLGALILISGTTHSAIFLASFFNCIFFGVTCFAIYKLSIELFKNLTIGLVAVITFGLFPETLPYTLFYMPDIVFVGLFTWGLFFFIRYLEVRSSRLLIFSSMLLGFSVLTKPIGIPFVFIFAIVLFVWCASRGRAFLEGFRSAMLIILVASAVISPWIARNWVAFDQLGVSSISGTNVFSWNYVYLLQQKYPNEFDDILAIKRSEVLAGLTSEQLSNSMLVSARLGSFARTAILSDLTTYIWVTIKRHPRLYAGTGSIALFRALGDGQAALQLEHFISGQSKWSSLDLRVRFVQGGSWIVLFTLYIATLYGTLRLLVERQWYQSLVLLGVCMVFIVLIGPLTLTRYRLVLLPALSILAGYGFIKCFRRRIVRSVK